MFIINEVTSHGDKNSIIAIFIKISAFFLNGALLTITHWTGCKKSISNRKDAHSIYCNRIRLTYIWMCKYLGVQDKYKIRFKAKTITLCPYRWKICMQGVQDNAGNILRAWSRMHGICENIRKCLSNKQRYNQTVIDYYIVRLVVYIECWLKLRTRWQNVHIKPR